MAKDFLEHMLEEERVLAISLKESRRAKAERTSPKRFPTAEERWPRRGVEIKQYEFPFIDNEKDELEDERGVNHGRTT
jgi:hypothetical protein